MRVKKIFPYLILLPALFFFITFRLVPMIFTFFRSIFEYNNGAWSYNSFLSYKEIFTDVNFWKAILNTLLIFLIYVLFKFPLVYLTAAAISKLKKHGRIYLFIMYLPMLVGMFAYGIIYRYMFTYDGIVNAILYGLFRFKINWLGDSLAAQNVVVFAMLWSSFGVSVLMLSNVISTTPKSLLNFAKIEGASKFRIFWNITLPHIKPMLITLLVLTIIETVGLIDVPMNLTQGGPQMATVTLGYYIYKQAFDYSNFSNASAVSVILFIVTAIPLSIYGYYKCKPKKVKTL